MKSLRKFSILCALLLTSCISPKIINSSDSSNNETTLTLSMNFVFDVKVEDDHYLADLTYQGEYYIFPSKIELDAPRVAGDQLKVIFDGEYSYICQYTYPSLCHVEGTIKEYHHIQTQILEIHVDDGTISSIANEIESGYILDTKNVVLDEVGHFVPLNEYDGQDLFLSHNLRKMDKYCSCPDGAECEPCPTYIAGLYAFNPRP